MQNRQPNLAKDGRDSGASGPSLSIELQAHYSRARTRIAAFGSGENYSVSDAESHARKAFRAGLGTLDFSQVSQSRPAPTSTSKGRARRPPDQVTTEHIGRRQRHAKTLDRRPSTATAAAARTPVTPSTRTWRGRSWRRGSAPSGESYPQGATIIPTSPATRQCAGRSGVCEFPYLSPPRNNHFRCATPT